MNTVARFARPVLAAAVVVAGSLAGAQTTQPAERQQTTQPAEQQTTQPPAAEAQPALAPVEVDASAAEIISKMRSAYGKLTALEVAGEMSGNIDVAGQKSQPQQEFTGSYQAPNKFRHESKDGIVLGSTGEKLYIFYPAENVYSSIPASADKLDNVPQ